MNALKQGSSTFFSPRTPWLKETLSRDPHPRRPKFGPDIHIFYLELSVCHSHTLIYIYTYYTALLNAVECSIHLNGASQRSVVNYFSIFDRCYA